MRKPTKERKARIVMTALYNCRDGRYIDLPMADLPSHIAREIKRLARTPMDDLDRLTGMAHKVISQWYTA